MDPAAHDQRPAQRLLPASRADLRAALPVAPARDAAEGPGQKRPAHAEGAHPDEHPAGQRDLRCGRRERPENPSGHQRRGTGWTGARRPQEHPHPRQRRRNRQEPARHLEGRTPVRAQAGPCHLRLDRHPAHGSGPGDRAAIGGVPNPGRRAGQGPEARGGPAMRRSATSGASCSGCAGWI